MGLPAAAERLKPLKLVTLEQMRADYRVLWGAAFLLYP